MEMRIGFRRVHINLLAGRYLWRHFNGAGEPKLPCLAVMSFLI